MKTRWNTGRPYTKQGQMIEAELKGKTVTFEDFSRKIKGTFEVACPEFITTQQDLQMAVLHRYDRNVYQSL